MTPTQFLSAMLEDGLSSRHAKELLKISRALAELDLAAASKELPFDPALPDITAVREAARRKLAGKLKTLTKAAGTGWRAEQAGPTGLRIAAPGRVAFTPVPWEKEK